MPTSQVSDLQHISRKRYECVSWVTVVVTTIVILFHWRSGGQKAPMIWLLLTNCPVAIYPIIGYFYEKKNHRLLSRYAESSYFIGYATTIASLLVIAVQVPQMGDLIENVGLILESGASAVLSTVIGLGGMFILRLRVQTLEDAESDEEDTSRDSNLIDQGEQAISTINEKSMRIVEALDNLLSRFETSQSDAITQVSLAAGRLAENMTKIECAAQDVAETLAALQPKIAATALGLDSLVKQAGTMVQVSSETSQVTLQIESTWKSLNRELSAFVSSAASIKDTSAIFETLKVEIGGCSQTARNFTDAVGATEKALVKHLTMLEQRADKVGNLTEGVKGFIEAANVIAPTINSIVANMNEVSLLKDKIYQLGGNLNVANEALTGIGKAMSTMTDNGSRLSVKTGDFVEQMEHQIHSLQRLSEPLMAFTRTLEAAKPQLTELAGDVEQISKLNQSVTKVYSTLAGLDAQTESSIQRIRELDVVAADLVETEKELQQLIRNKGR